MGAKFKFKTIRTRCFPFKTIWVRLVKFQKLLKRKKFLKIPLKCQKSRILVGVNPLKKFQKSSPQGKNLHFSSLCCY
jgi:hypothetical protein